MATCSTAWYDESCSIMRSEYRNRSIVMIYTVKVHQTMSMGDLFMRFARGSAVQLSSVTAESESAGPRAQDIGNRSRLPHPKSPCAFTLIIRCNRLNTSTTVLPYGPHCCNLHAAQMLERYRPILFAKQTMIQVHY